MTKITNSALCRFGVALLVAASSFSAQAQTVQTNSSATGYGGGGGSGTVTSMSVASANGLAGTVANPTTTPAITLSTSITGVLKGNGTAVAQAASGSDYVAPATTVNGHALSANVTVTASDVGLGSVANVDTTNAANITSGTLAAARGGAGATSGVLKANGSGLVSAAASGTDYAPATSGSSILKGNGAGGTAAIVSGTDLKTINSTSLIGSGDIAISTTPAGSGSEIQYRNAGAFGAVTGSSVSGANVTLGGTMTVTQSIPASGTVTVSTPLINGTQLWNNGATTFDLDSLTATDTASASGSTVFKRVVGASTVAKIDKSGNETLTGSITAAGAAISSNASFTGTLKVATYYTTGSDAAEEVYTGNKSLTNNTATGVYKFVPGTDQAITGVMTYTVIVRNTTGHQLQSTTGQVPFACHNVNGTLASSTPTAVSTAQLLSTGTDAISFSVTTDATSCSLLITSNTSLTATSHTVTAKFWAPETGAITVL